MYLIKWISIFCRQLERVYWKRSQSGFSSIRLLVAMGLVKQVAHSRKCYQIVLYCMFTFVFVYISYTGVLKMQVNTFIQNWIIMLKRAYICLHKRHHYELHIFIQHAVSVNSQIMYGELCNRPLNFCSCVKCNLASVWKRGWNWPCFDKDQKLVGTRTQEFTCQELQG